VVSMSFDANPGGAHQEIGKRTYCRAWWKSTHEPNAPSSILCFFLFFCFGEVQQQTRYDKLLTPLSQAQEGRQEFHLHTTGLEPRTFCSHSILEWANTSER
jgi:hypothetical protein